MLEAKIFKNKTGKPWRVQISHFLAIVTYLIIRSQAHSESWARQQTCFVKKKSEIRHRSSFFMNQCKRFTPLLTVFSEHLIISTILFLLQTWPHQNLNNRLKKLYDLLYIVSDIKKLHSPRLQVCRQIKKYVKNINHTETYL